MLNAADVLALLADATTDTIVHLDYLAGRPATAKAVKECAEASDWNKPPTSYVGHFGGIRRNRFGEPVLTLFVHNRGETGKPRAFNPALGTVLSLKVVQP